MAQGVNPESGPLARPFNWKEWERWGQAHAALLEGARVQAIGVPERPQFSGGFIKDEFLLRFSGARRDGSLVVSLRSRAPYLYWSEGRGPRASSVATRSGFLMALSKRLVGCKVRGLEVVAHERVVALWFSQSDGSEIGLAFYSFRRPRRSSSRLQAANSNDVRGSGGNGSARAVCARWKDALRGRESVDFQPF